jgi:hypothetical protein
VKVYRLSAVYSPKDIVYLSKACNPHEKEKDDDSKPYTTMTSWEACRTSVF